MELLQVSQIDFLRNTINTSFDLIDSDLIAIDVIFKTCETDGTDGLSLMEITEVACMQTLSSTFGITEDNVDKIFWKLDQDQNQIVSLTEAIKATSLLNRSKTTI